MLQDSDSDDNAAASEEIIQEPTKATKQPTKSKHGLKGIRIT